jgi:hypothetical protein
VKVDAGRVFLVARLDPRRSTAEHWSTGKPRAAFAKLDDAVSFALGAWQKDQRKRTWFVVDAGTLDPSLDRSLLSSEEASIVFRAERPQSGRSS